MSKSERYYDIFSTKTHLEYHFSMDKEEVRYRESMSRRTTIGNPAAGRMVVEWFNEAEFYGAKRVHSTATKRK